MKELAQTTYLSATLKSSMLHKELSIYMLLLLLVISSGGNDDGPGN